VEDKHFIAQFSLSIVDALQASPHSPLSKQKSPPTSEQELKTSYLHTHCHLKEMTLGDEELDQI
jgi:hypothetical protein